MKFLKSFRKLSPQKKFGFLLLFSILIVNQYVWLWIFDNDGYLKEINKIRFSVINFGSLVIGLSLIYLDFKIKIIAKNIFFFIYIVLFLEICSYFTIKILLINNENLKEKIKYIATDNISKFTPDLRSDYKPNKFHPEVNQFGFRFGGKAKNEDSFRIMCIGGSTTWGDGAKDSSTTYPAQLESFLKSKGYHVNVINAGVPYHTSLDVLMRFISKGIYFKPDMLLIHTGLNDNGPAQSPFAYQPDYSHWRQVNYNNSNLFKTLWNDFPFSISRIFFIFYFNFDSQTSLSFQTSSVPKELLATTQISKKRTEGFKNYFSAILSISKANNIIPITVKINNDHNRKNSYAKRFFKEKSLKYAIARDKNITLLHNSIMDSISLANKVKTLPFDDFKPSSLEHWYDNCHLTEAGIKEKAIFIGKFLMNEFKIPKK